MFSGFVPVLFFLSALPPHQAGALQIDDIE
jgi:hypothetical protein